MANKMRWRYGDTNPVMLPVLSDTVIEIGDLIYLDTNNAKPASALADQGSLNANQVYLHLTFAGVAMQASELGDTGTIRIATTGVFEFETDAATYELGNLLGPTENGAGDQLEDQRVEKTSQISSALGRCAKRSDAPVTRVLVDIVSTVMKGGPQSTDISNPV